MFAALNFTLIGVWSAAPIVVSEPPAARPPSRLPLSPADPKQPYSTEELDMLAVLYTIVKLLFNQGCLEAVQRLMALIGAFICAFIR